VLSGTTAAPERFRPVTTLVSRIGFVEPMMPALVDSAPEGSQWIHELKYDGYRTQLALSGSDRRAYTRRGHDWSRLYAPVLDVAARLDCESALIDGEMIVQDDRGLPDFEGLRRELAKRRPSGLVFMAFDLLHLDGIDLRREPVEDRRARLHDLLGSNEAGRCIQFSDHVTGGGSEFFELADRMGLEGIVSKKLGSRYRSGQGRSWLKVKAFTEGEYVVIGAARGDLAPVALLARETEDRRLEYVGGAMVTFAESERERFWRATERLKVEKPPLHIEKRKDTTWLKPEMRVRVRHLKGEEMLRHATLKSISYLPPVPSIAKPKDPPPKPPRTEPSYKLADDAIPSRDALAGYYEAVGPLTLPFLSGRPLNLFRCPRDARNECVFQRNRNHPPTPEQLFREPIRQIPVLQKNGRTENYLYVDSNDGILACVEADAVEFHGWGSLVPDIERPDRIAFDLDPDEGLDFAYVKRTAFELRDRLAAIGLESFPLLSGGKGIHVVVPLIPGAEWDEVRGFARQVCTAMADDEPDRFTVAIAKAKRKGRIFLDYLRNQRTATAIMPYSVRARPGAPVAAPVSWEELVAIGTPQAFSIGDARRLVRRASKLRGWGVASQSLPQAGQP
jgi:bifunctional non-homologous end joining protein LigD